MEFLQNQFLGLACLGFLIAGIVMTQQKDTLSESRKSTRDAGLVFIIVSVLVLAYRGFQYRSGYSGLTGGVRCKTDPTDPNCTFKSSDMTAFERFLYTIGLKHFAQSRTRARFGVISKKNDFDY